MQYWLMKTEPTEFSIDDLERRPNQTEHWDGVRNYQARNMIRDQMKAGDQVLIYHSNCDQPGVTGIAAIAREAYPDPTAFIDGHKHFDPKSQPEAPRWFMVDVRFVRKLKRTISLAELKAHAELADLALVRKGNRLSVMPVDATQWQYILDLE